MEPKRLLGVITSQLNDFSRMKKVCIWLCLVLCHFYLLAADDFSVVETQLFMLDHFKSSKLPSHLSYVFKKSGSLEPGFDDKVDLKIKAKTNGGCCHTKIQFLSNEHSVQLPEPEEIKGNPVILYFLERDIRDMERLTKGKSNYFRSRIRKALYQHFQDRQVRLLYRGQSISAQEFEIAPYADDELRSRYNTLADKHYAFVVSHQVPGYVVEIRSWIPTGGEKPSLWKETLKLEGIEK